MKAHELGAKEGDYIARRDDPYASLVYLYEGKLCIAYGGYGRLSLEQCPVGEWQLFTPRPELGEPVKWDELETGENVLVLTPDGRLTPGFTDPANIIMFCSSGYSVDSIHSGNKSYVIYRDPRPLPSLPKREPTLEEKIVDLLEQYPSTTRGCKQALAAKIVALLETSTPESGKDGSDGY